MYAVAMLLPCGHYALAVLLLCSCYVVVLRWVRCAFDNVYTGYQCFTVTFSAAVAALSCLPSLSLRVVVALCPPTASFCSSDKALGANKSHVF